MLLIIYTCIMLSVDAAAYTVAAFEPRNYTSTHLCDPDLGGVEHKNTLCHKITAEKHMHLPPDEKNVYKMVYKSQMLCIFALPTLTYIVTS